MSEAKHTPGPLGDWRKPLFDVEVLPSIPDPRKFITVHADDADHAVWVAERHGYRAYVAQPILTDEEKANCGLLSELFPDAA